MRNITRLGEPHMCIFFFCVSECVSVSVSMCECVSVSVSVSVRVRACVYVNVLVLPQQNHHFVL